MTERGEKNLIIDVQNVTKKYLGTTALNNVSLGIFASEFTLINGPSGSGKTTLLNTISSIDRPDFGQIVVDGRDITTFSKRERERYRGKVGSVFQRSGLLANLTAIENIQAPHDVIGNTIDKEWLDYLLMELSVSSLVDRKVSGLSGGQAQRIGIIRALAHNPDLIFADEPTASLDQDSKHQIHNVFRRIVTENDKSVIMVSHDEISKQYADTVTSMRDGTISSSQINTL